MIYSTRDGMWIKRWRCYALAICQPDERCEGKKKKAQACKFDTKRSGDFVHHGPDRWSNRPTLMPRLRGKVKSGHSMNKAAERRMLDWAALTLGMELGCDKALYIEIPSPLSFPEFSPIPGVATHAVLASRRCKQNSVGVAGTPGMEAWLR